MVSGQGNDKEGATILNVIIWVEGAVFEHEPLCVAKTRGKFQLRSSTQGRCPDDATKGNPALEKVWGRRLQGPMQRRVLMCWLKAGER